MRYYSIALPDGTKRSLPSVTTILDVTMPAAKRSTLELKKAQNPLQYFQKRDEARERGSYIHRYAATRLTGKRMGHGAYGKWLKHLDRWLQTFAIPTNFVWTEQQVYDLEKGYAGTYDILLPWYEQTMTVVDIKTTAYRIWPEAIASAQLQTAAYLAAWNQNHHTLKAEQIATVHVSPYRLECHVTSGADLESLIAAFYQRCKEFGARLTEAHG